LPCNDDEDFLVEGRLLQLLATCHDGVIKWCTGYWDQACWGGTQISGSDASSRHL